MYFSLVFIRSLMNAVHTQKYIHCCVVHFVVILPRMSRLAQDFVMRAKCLTYFL